MEARSLPTLDLRLPGLSIRSRAWRGRFPEEWNLDIDVCPGNECGRAFSVKVFLGRPPYRAWAEVHSVVRPELMLGAVEDHVIGVLSSWLRPGETLYFEYVWDPITTRELELGVPPQASRLGYKLLMHGFTWMKDWYYPEGFMEGSPKLQAEKPLSPGHGRRHLLGLLGEVERALSRRSLLPGGAVSRLLGLRGIIGALYNTGSEA